MLLGFFILILFVLLAMGTQVGIALAIAGIFLFLVHGGIPIEVIAQNIFKSSTSYAFTAIPFFILVGNLMMQGTVLNSIVKFSTYFFKKVTGGLAIGIMGLSAFFGSISGSSVASVAALGNATVQALQDKYPKRFVAGLVATGGTMGIMIPPSLSFIAIGGIAGIPILDLFKAGFLVGLMEALLLMVTIYLICKIKKYDIVSHTEKTGAKVYFSNLGKYAFQSWSILLMPIIIIVGIFSGIFTPTEIAAVAAAYSFLVVTVIYRQVTGKTLYQVVQKTIYQSAMIYMIIIGGNLLAFMVTRLGFTEIITNFFTQYDVKTWQFLLLVNIVLLIMGMFLDGISVIILTTPLLFPLALHFGVHPIHFAVMMTANIEIATITPPVGLNLYVMSGVTKLPVVDVARGVGPLYITQILFLLLVTYIPALSLIWFQ